MCADTSVPGIHTILIASRMGLIAASVEFGYTPGGWSKRSHFSSRVELSPGGDLREPNLHSHRAGRQTSYRGQTTCRVDQFRRSAPTVG